MKISRFASLALVALLAACSQDSTAPRLTPPTTAAALLGPDEGVRVISDTVDASGNLVMVNEYGAGSYLDGSVPGTTASVTVKTVVPQGVAAVPGSIGRRHTVITISRVDSPPA